MDERARPRIPSDLTARITNLTANAPPVEATIVDVSLGGVCAMTPVAIPLGNIVRLDLAEGLLFGVVVHVTALERTQRIGIEVFDVLLEDSDLARLVTAALGSVEERRSAAGLRSPDIVG